MRCEKCGYVNNNNMKYCPNCGTELISNSTQNIAPNQNINQSPMPNNGFNPGFMQYNPNMNNGYMSNSYNNNKKGLIIGMVSVLLIAAVVIILLLTGVIGGKNDGNKEKTGELNNNGAEVTKPKEEEKTNVSQYKYINIDLNKLGIVAEDSGKYTKNIEIEKAFLVYNSISKEKTVDSIIVLAKNNNDVAVNISAELGFYDREGYQVETNLAYNSAVRPHTEFVFELSTLTDKGNDYDNYKVTYNASKTPERYKDIGITKKDVEAVLGDKIGNYPNSIMFSYKNTIGKKVDEIGILVKFYKDNDLVFADKARLSSITEGVTKIGEAYGTRRYGIEHDRYEYIISTAYIYDNENW